MRKIIVFISVLAGFAFNNYAIAHSIILKGSFSGVVKDKSTGLPIEGATVYIADIKAGCNTSSKGEFSISNISEATYIIEVSHIGYATLAESISIHGDTKRDFLLAESIVENNAVIVTGVTNATQVKKVPFQVSVMRKDELQQTVSTNIIEAITRKAGVSSLSTGPAIAKPLIRGLGYNRVLTINDGVRQEGQQWGDEHGIEVDEASVNKIEILKGPASLVYGSDAMAGVINIITNVPVQTNSIKINAGSNYQTNNRQRSFYGSVAGNVVGFNWNVYGTVKAAADYTNKYDGRVFNSKFNEHNVGGYVGYNGNWGYSHLLVSNFNLKAGLIEGERDSAGFFIKPVAGGGEMRAGNDDFMSTNPQVPYQHIRHFKMATDNSFNLGKQRLAVNVAWQHNQREEFGNADNPFEQSLYFDLKTITYTTQLHFKKVNGWKTSMGVNGMNQQNTNKGMEQLIPDYTLNDIGVYGFFQKDLKKLTVSGGIRFDTRHINVASLQDGSSIKGEAFTKDFSNFSGSVGTAYELNKNVNFKLNIARAFRAPGIPELASNGSHEGTIRYEYGDKNLKSEISTQADISAEFNNEHLTFNIAGYFNNFSNFIFYRKLLAINGADSTVNENGTVLTAFRFDQQRAFLAGMEATLDIHPHPFHWLHLQNTFSFVSGRLKEAVEESRNLPFIPAPKLLTEIRADIKALNSVFTGFYIKFELDNTFAQNNPFTAYNTETTTAGYTLLHAGIGTNVSGKKGQTLFTINLSVNNITDVAYQSHLSRLKYAAQNLATGRIGVYNMGRNFSLKLNVPLSMPIRKY